MIFDFFTDSVSAIPRRTVPTQQSRGLAITAVRMGKSIFPLGCYHMNALI